MHQEEKKRCRSASGATTHTASKIKRKPTESNATGNLRSLLVEESELLLKTIDHIRNLTDLNIHNLSEGITICAALNILTNEKEASKLVKRARPASGFHHKPAVVRELVECLRHWTEKERILSIHNSLRMAIKVLIKRFDENLPFLIKL